MVPAVLCLILLVRKDWRRAAYFLAPGVVLLAWLMFLHRSTGYWLGNPGFAHYNVAYALHPARVAMSFATTHLLPFFCGIPMGRHARAADYDSGAQKSSAEDVWRVVIAVAVAHIVLVTLLGGAELERYLLPVLPLFLHCCRNRADVPEALTPDRSHHGACGRTACQSFLESALPISVRKQLRDG